MPGRQMPLGELLSSRGLITREQIEFVLHEQKATGERLGETLLRLGFVTDSDLARVLAEQSNMDFFDVRSFNPDIDLLTLLPYTVAKKHAVLPLFEKEGKLHVAIADPFDPAVGEAVFRITGKNPVLYVAAANQLNKLIERHYYMLEHPVEKEIERVVSNLRQNPDAEVEVGGLVDNLFRSAITFRATDMHISPSDLSTRVLFRIDGVMRLAHVFPAALHPRLTTNIKVRSDMDISEQRRPQDGRMSFDFLGDFFDVRVSSLRTNHGENLVMRLLPSRGSSSFSINDVGFDEEDLQKVHQLFKRPFGMVLVTGPTGSGKTTTLYASLREQDYIGKNILTVEDPIEYEFLMIRQTQVNEKADYTFSSAIRTFLRQDPDIILVGEIRDEETAIMAIRAALTGHLLLSTLHTNTAIGAIARLKDLGITPFLLSSALAGVISQRLVRLLCPHCKEEYRPRKRLLELYNLPEDHIYWRGKGCPQCRDSGYYGRTAISEVLVCNKEICHLIGEDAPLKKIEEMAREYGFHDFISSGRTKVLKGLTDVDELYRVLG